MRISPCARALGALASLVEEGISQTLAIFNQVSETVRGRQPRRFHRTAASLLALSACAGLAGRASAATIFSDDFESSTSSSATAQYTAAPTAHGTYSFEDADGATVRIGRGFSTSASATSYRLSFQMYSSSTASSQRYYGQISSGTAAVPGTGTGQFFRIAANNDANSKYNFLYSNGATTTVVTSNAITVGWHTFAINIKPGAAGVGTISYQIDGGSVVPVTTTGLVAVPTNVQLGQTASNGTAGTPDTSAWMDDISVEQFATASTAASSPSPSNTATGADPNSTVLSWAVGANTSSQDIYFGTSPTPGLVASAQSASLTSYNPGTLSPNTTYYWEVAEKNALGDATTASVWSFTTAPAPEPTAITLLGLAGITMIRRRKA
jgi:hypothetical protein